MERVEMMVKANELLDECGVRGDAGVRVQAIENITQIIEYACDPRAGDLA